MVVFYCILLVLLLFMILIEINAQPHVNILGATDNPRHSAHLLVYTVLFICICFLLYNHLYR